MDKASRAGSTGQHRLDQSPAQSDSKYIDAQEMQRLVKSRQKQSVNGKMQNISQQNLIRKTSRPRLGELLLAAELLTKEQLDDALEIAKESRQLIGRTLVFLDFVQERDIESALLAQTLIDKGTLTHPSAINALRLAAGKSVSIAQVVKEMQTRGESAITPDDALGILLLSAGYITSDSYMTARQKCSELGHLLGRTLLLLQTITVDTLNNALSILVLVRRGSLSLEDGIRVLQEVRNKRIDLDSAFINLRMPIDQKQKELKFGELLIHSRIILMPESLAAVERGLTEKQLVGEVLVASGLITRDILTAAVSLQKLVLNGVVTKDEAAEALQRVKLDGLALKQVANSMRLFKDRTDAGRALSFLQKAGCLTSSDLAHARNAQLEFVMDPGKAVLAMGLISRQLFSAAEACAEYVEHKKLSGEQAILALRYCERHRCNAVSALASMGVAVDQETAQAAQTLIPHSGSGHKIWLWVGKTEVQQLATVFGCIILVNIVMVLAAPRYLYIVDCPSMLIVMFGLYRIGISLKKRVVTHQAAERESQLEVAKNLKARLHSSRRQ